MFEPRVVAVRQGQNFVIKNSAVIAHNANWVSTKNGAFNRAIASGGQLKLAAALVGEQNTITLACTTHGWMNAYIRVFDHPYFAVTDKDGKFEIPAILPGAYNVYMWHETGWIGGKARAKGAPVDIVAGVNDLKDVEWKFPE